ncbi:cyclic nucleotide-binding domain-containing protein [Leptospira levettii]|uniref:Cyclic nucleotide-binding domain-containing protein n=1 Tax=Leptospira levettii TaxID=2023178 RepID=A0AAW5V3H9_9LEPT|nr:cyclic nucleotide-binding domain-containing protein [Leptospira levettii]MCW7465044.1 cyclic nucleotide-binding domain-containing protein [Leptospira levettii]MCW7509784.1 cyclic nucleotide-binding domain-containing protein [Leptospira levettii]MCW7513534.1 cyclic nucleotide-binding domain-containing protein [Leptospira levettii]TGM92716.1 phospholipase [Leptospira levettii]
MRSKTITPTLKQIISSTDLFLNLSKETKEHLERSFHKVNFVKNKVVIKQGEHGNALYLVATGSFSVYVTNDGKKQKLGEVKPGSCFGEGALVTDEPRNATVVCDQSGIVYRIDRNEFKRAFKDRSEELKAFVRLISRRSRALHRSVFRPEPRRIKELISSVSLFQGVGKKLISELEQQMEWIFLPGGETLMRQGDKADGMYVVVNGSLVYEVRNDQGLVVSTGNFSKGDIIGEMALLTGEPRTATVVATLSCEIVKISTVAFEAVFSKHPPSMLAITKLIADRFTKDRMGKRTVKKTRSIITLFPLQKDLSVRDFAHNLANALKKNGRTIIVESKDFKKKKGDREHVVSDILESLYHLQDTHDFLILCPDFDDKLWTETILHHTNRILLLSDAKKADVLSPEEIRFLGDSEETHGPIRELVLLYSDPNEKPKNISNLTKIRKTDVVRHIRTYSHHGFESLTRFITGRSIGLALGGGGAKGFAHIGLIKAMQEENIPIDMIGGTSAGALMASIYALGNDAPSLERIAKALMSDKKTLNDYTIPVVSLIRGKKFNTVIKSFVGETMIEDLWLPYFAVATSLSKAQKVIIDRGPLWKALRASASIPGILPPFFENNELLVDGAMLDNIPGAVMREKGADFVISVALASEGDSAADELFGRIYPKNNSGALPSALRLLFKRLFRKAQNFKEAPNLLSLLMRATFVASDAAMAQAKAESDIFAELPVEQYGLFDWKKFYELVEIGYRYGKTNAKTWKKQLGIQS